MSTETTALTAAGMPFISKVVIDNHRHLLLNGEKFKSGSHFDKLVPQSIRHFKSLYTKKKHQNTGTNRFEISLAPSNEILVSKSLFTTLQEKRRAPFT